MLIKVTVSNFLSFSEKAELRLEAGSIREFPKNAFRAKHGTQEIKLLKNVNLFGANSSGKTNFFNAFLALRHWVITSAANSNPQAKIPVQPYILKTTTERQPSTLETEFLIDGIAYRYGFSADADKIHQEWLFTTAKRKEENVFVRVFSDFQVDKRFQGELKQKLRVLTEFTKSNVLFLSVLNQFNIGFAEKITDWFRKNTLYTDLSIDRNIDLTSQLVKDDRYRTLIYEILQKSDLGFSTIQDELEERIGRANLHRSREALFYAIHDDAIRSYKVKTRHQKFDENLELDSNIYFDLLEQESAGAQKFLALLGPIVKAMVDGEIIWIDELDSRLHTHLVNLLILLVNSNQHNHQGCQAIFTTHNIQVFKKIRRDQMILLNKNRFGESTIASVYHGHPQVRGDASFEKEYLNDQLGGVPQISRQLFIDFDNESTDDK